MNLVLNASLSGRQKADLDAPEPELKLLLGLAGDVQGAQPLLTVVLVQQGEGHGLQLGVGVALEDVCRLSLHHLNSGQAELRDDWLMYISGIYAGLYRAVLEDVWARDDA